MKRYCYYSNGILQEATSSKNIAKMLLRGELASSEKVLDMQSGLWVPVAKQANIVRIYHSMRKVHEPTFAEFYLRDTLVDERRDVIDCPYTSPFSLNPFYVLLFVFIRFLTNVVRKYILWRKE